ncbi:MAG: hypothetical protein JNL29_14960 [Nitrospira sp.]|nr:hypothetical protein [Nitrospira sp.]
MDVVFERCSIVRALATVTDSLGSGWLAEAASSPWSDPYFHEAKPIPRRRTTKTRTIDPIQF